MAMSWDNVELIRNAQASAKQRFEATALATQDEIKKALESETAKALALPRITEIEQMIFKLRAELIDYIVAHGLVDGMIWNGQLQKVENGKIVVTADMIDAVVKFLGYFQESDVQAFLEKYLPANDYVQDGNYVHTDNNYTDEAVEKLAGIENRAEVNKVIDVMFNGKTVLDDGTRVATITITPEDIKQWYEENPNTNAFTDVEKTKLAGIADGADVNRVDDVILNGRSTLDEQKRAILTKEDIKTAYEQNPDTNAFTDAEKNQLKQNTTNIEELGNELNATAGRVTGLEDRETVYTVLPTDASNVSRVGTGGGTWQGWGVLSFNQNGEAKTYNVPLSGSGFWNEGQGTATAIDLACGLVPFVVDGIPAIQNLWLHLGGSFKGGTSHIWQVLTCYHNKAVTDLTFELQTLRLSNSYESEPQIFHYTDKSLAWLTSGDYEPIQDGDMVIIGYKAKYGDEQKLKLGRQDATAAEVDCVNIIVPAVSKSTYAPSTAVPVETGFPISIESNVVYGISVEEFNVNQAGRLDFNLANVLSMTAKYINNGSIRGLPCSVVSSLDRWSLTIIR